MTKIILSALFWPCDADKVIPSLPGPLSIGHLSSTKSWVSPYPFDPLLAILPMDELRQLLVLGLITYGIRLNESTAIFPAIFACRFSFSTSSDIKELDNLGAWFAKLFSTSVKISSLISIMSRLCLRAAKSDFLCLAWNIRID